MPTECTSWQVAPCALQPVSHAGEFICICGTDCKATLCTSDGTVLSTLATRGAWLWCVSAHPKKNFVAVGSEDGSIAVYQLLFSTVHGLYHDRYAFRQDSLQAAAAVHCTSTSLHIDFLDDACWTCCCTFVISLHVTASPHFRVVNLTLALPANVGTSSNRHTVAK